MIKDNEIEAKMSPFAVRKNEIKVFDGSDKYISMEQIVKRINQGHINDLHFAIMEIINEFEFITSRQLCQLLEIKGIDYGSQEKLTNKLDQLIRTKILTRYYFSSEEGKGTFRVYSLEKMGKYLLNSRGIECKWQPTDNTKPVEMVKKRLAGNQVILSYMRKVKSFDSYVVKKSLTAKTIGKTFKTAGGCIKLTKASKSINFLFEVVRREDNWEKKLIDKVRMYKDFYENFVTMDSDFESLPQLIFVCEDDRHTIETFKTLVTNNMEIKQINYYFTTDLKQINEELTNSLTEFKLDEETKKYKALNVSLKLLEG